MGQEWDEDNMNNFNMGGAGGFGGEGGDSDDEDEEEEEEHKHEHVHGENCNHEHPPATKAADLGDLDAEAEWRLTYKWMIRSSLIRISVIFSKH